LPDDPDTVEQALANPDAFADKTIGQVADHYSNILGRLSRKPAVIGHSFGGLIAQIVRRARPRGRDRWPWTPPRSAGIPQLPLSSLRAASPVLSNPANRHRAVPLTYEQFRYSFANAGRRGPGQAPVRHVCRPGARRAPMAGSGGELQPADRGQGRREEP